MRELIPWWGRIGAKLVLSRLPAGYSIWRGLNLFRHGSMHRIDYALGVFRQHFAHSRFSAGQEFIALELGPGDSLSSAIISAAYGAAHTYLVDAGSFATSQLKVYRAAARQLRSMGMNAPDLENVRDLGTVLQACRASYYTQGLKSLREIPSASVDFIWSHAVLEHIRKHEFRDFIQQTRRVLRSGGICSHQIDLQDHLGGALNNMRISSRWWEAQWMANSGFYTNRLRMADMMEAFRSAGFITDVTAISRWKKIPTSPTVLAPEFQHYDADELLVKTFAVVLAAP